MGATLTFDSDMFIFYSSFMPGNSRSDRVIVVRMAMGRDSGCMSTMSGTAPLGDMKAFVGCGIRRQLLCLCSLLGLIYPIVSVEQCVIGELWVISASR